MDSGTVIDTKYHPRSEVGIVIEDLHQRVLSNREFKKVIYDTPYMTLELVNLAAKENILREIHPDLTQFMTVIKGMGIVSLGESEEYVIKDGSSVTINPGISHYIENPTDEPLLMYFIYINSPSNLTLNSEDWNDAVRSKQLERNLKKLPVELQTELYKHKSVDEYINMCKTSKSQFRKCLTPGHWKGYLRGKNIEDGTKVVLFALNYVIDYPSLFAQVSKEFIDEYIEDIYVSNLLGHWPYVNAEELKYYESKYGLQLNTNMDFEDDGIEYRLSSLTTNDIKIVARCINKIRDRVIAIKERLISDEYNESIDGPLNYVDLKTSKRFSTYKLLIMFYKTINLISPSSGSIVDQEDLYLEFIILFIENVHISEIKLVDDIFGMLMPIVEKIDGDVEVSESIYYNFVITNRNLILGNVSKKDIRNYVKEKIKEILDDYDVVFI